jgi:hypothetical protein
MKQQEVFKRIGVIIKELNDQFEYLKTVEGPLNELELELFLANSHFLGDHVLILSKLNAQNSAAKKPAEKPEAPHEQNFFVPLVHTPSQSFKAPERPFEIAKDEYPAPKIDLEPSSEDTYSFMHEDEPETIRHELVLDEADWDEEDEPYEPNTVHEALKQEVAEEVPIIEPIAEKEEVIAPPPIVEEPEPVIQETIIPEPVAPEPIVAAKEPEPVIAQPVTQAKKEEVLTINERMSAKLAAMAGVGGHVQNQSISDLKQGINLNDKLLFIKELFNGYSLAYSEAIEILNRFTSFNEADLFLKKNYVVKNAWESKPETVGKFYTLLKRRYE